MGDYDVLFRPLQLAGLTLKNRLLSAPTSLAELGPEEHYSEANINYYRLKAAGGCALVTVGDVIVDLDTGRSHPQQVGINDPGSMPYLVRMAEAIHAGGAAASVEIDHGGALCSPEFIGGKNAIGPSGYVDDWGDTVEEMTVEQMYEVADKYAEAAANAKAFGFDMVMLHMGHGWLLHQFISELTNHRTDEWGGSFENRMRFPLLVVDKVRAAVGRSFPIDVRISGSERIEGGYGIETGIKIAQALDGKVDLIHVSAGTQEDEYSAVLMHPGAFQKHGENSGLAAEIKKHVKTPVCTVGAFSEPDKMVSFMKESGVDAIAMGRALLADPFLPVKLLRGQADRVRPCLRCGECQSGMMKQRVLHCAVNPLIGSEENYYHPVPTYHPNRTVLIAGGGPSGCQAADEAVKRGHKVVLCEKSDRLGGLKYADNADFKYNIARYREYIKAQTASLPIDIRLNTTVTQEIVDEVKPDVLIIAIGAQPWMLPVPRDEKADVVFGADLRKDTPVGENVVVVGGGLIGSEEAVALAREGHKVVILEMQEELAPDCGRMHRINLLHQIQEEPGITVATGHRCTGIGADCVTAVAPDGKEVSFAADTVVMAAGMRPDNKEVERLRAMVPECYVAGDAFRARQIGQATRDAVNAVVNLGL